MPAVVSKRGIDEFVPNEDIGHTQLRMEDNNSLFNNFYHFALRMAETGKRVADVCRKFGITE